MWLATFETFAKINFMVCPSAATYHTVFHFLAVCKFHVPVLILKKSAKVKLLKNLALDGMRNITHAFTYVRTISLCMYACMYKHLYTCTYVYSYTYVQDILRTYCMSISPTYVHVFLNAWSF